VSHFAYLLGDWYHSLLWADGAYHVWQTEDPKSVDSETLLDYYSFGLAKVCGERVLASFHLEKHPFY